MTNVLVHVLGGGLVSRLVGKYGLPPITKKSGGVFVIGGGISVRGGDGLDGDSGRERGPVFNSLHEVRALGVRAETGGEEEEGEGEEEEESGLSSSIGSSSKRVSISSWRVSWESSAMCW